MKRVIIIGDSLTNDFASPEERYLGNSVNIGERVIARVFGSEKNYGRGPLPEFLRAASVAKEMGDQVHTILVQDMHDPRDPNQQQELLRYGSHNIIGSEGADFVDPIRDIAKSSLILNTDTLSIPVSDFHRIMGGILHKDILALSKEERDEVIFIVCGFYTNLRIKNTAEKLRHDYRFNNVYVSPHLTGSRDHMGHMNTLQADLPNALIKVVSDLGDIWKVAGLTPQGRGIELMISMKILPGSVAENLNEEQIGILKTLFLLNDEVNIRLLAGGYSGSVLCLAQGRIAGAKTEPVVVKIDNNTQMFREISGYNLVKDYLGKNVPTFAIPISSGELTGVKMELASMQGNPTTLQNLFEEARDDTEFRGFMTRFESTLTILGEKLYKNKLSSKKMYPYREFRLHAKNQIGFLNENIRSIVEVRGDTFELNGETVHLDRLLETFETLTNNVDRLEGEVTLSHGDLNLANIISDRNENIWIIDWTHAGERPIELDYAKIENDIKYVMSKEFKKEDLSKLATFEGYILDTVSLPDISELPEDIGGIVEDFRFRKIYMAIQALRREYLATKGHANEVIYHIALLRYATHTLSFDRARGRGECDNTQLKYALIGTSLLLSALQNDPLHRFGPLQKAKNYPDRFRVPEEKIAWSESYEGYAPAEYTRKDIAEKNPEDGETRPLNPRGRTGITGRGALYGWGANHTVDPVITRKNPFSGKIELFLVKRKNTHAWEIPGTFIHEGEDAIASAKRGIREKTGLEIPDFKSDTLGEIFIEDDRNTDNAWVESIGLHLHIKGDIDTSSLPEIADTEYSEWVDIESNVLHGLYANHAMIIRAALENLLRKNELSDFDTEAIQKALSHI